MGHAGMWASLSPEETQKNKRHGLKPYSKTAVTTTVWYRQKGRGTGQWDRKESSETDLHIHGQLIFNRGAHGERKVFSANVLEQLDIYMEKQ